MNAFITKEKLLAAINIVNKALPVRSTISILECVYLEANAQTGYITLMCDDLAIGIKTRVAAEITQDGAIAMPGRLFNDIIRYLPNGDIQLSFDEDLMMTIEGRGSRTKLQGLDASQYPEMDRVEGGDVLNVPAKIFKEMARACTIAAATDDPRVVLTGVLLEKDENILNMVALDGYKLCWMQFSTDEPGEWEAVVPAKILQEMARVIPEKDGDVHLVATHSHVLADMGDTRVIARCIDAPFINYKQVVPQNNPICVTINRKDFSDSIDRASLLSREGQNTPIQLHIQDDHLVVTARAQLGDVYDEIAITKTGGELVIAFNPKLISDILKVPEEDTITLNFNTALAPCIIKPVESDHYLCLVLPVRING